MTIKIVDKAENPEHVTYDQLTEGLWEIVNATGSVVYVDNIGNKTFIGKNQVGPLLINMWEKAKFTRSYKEVILSNK